MDINWDALGAIGELIGALGVILSLIYLGRQISTNTKSTSVNATTAFVHSYGQLHGAMMQNEDVAALAREGYSGLDGFSPDREYQYRMLILQYFYLWESMWSLRSGDMLPDARWNAIKANIQQGLSAPGPRLLFAQAAKQGIVSSDLVDEVISWPGFENILAEADASAPDADSTSVEDGSEPSLDEAKTPKTV